MHLYEAIKPVLIISMLTGTLPFHLTYRNRNYKLIVTKCTKTVIIIYIIFYTIVLIDAILIPSNQAILNYYQTVVSNLGLILELFGGILLTYLIYGMNLIYHESIRDIFVRITRVDHILIQMQNDLKYRYLFQYQLVQIMSGSLVLSATATLQYANAKASGLLMLSFSLRIVLVFPLLIIFIMESQYICLAILIKHRFEFINEQLAILGECMRIGSSRCVQLTPISRGLATKSSEYASPSPLRRLESIMHLHDSICDIVEKINYNYGCQILISIALKFTIFVFSIYYCYWSNVVKNRIWSSIFWMFWACYNMYELLHLAISCQKASTQGRLTGIQVHKLLLNTTNAAIKEKLNIFSQQIIHREVKFSAMGLFQIDATLLLSIISAGSTYLIIMLQFQGAIDTNKRTAFMLNATHIIHM